MRYLSGQTDRQTDTQTKYCNSRWLFSVYTHRLVPDGRLGVGVYIVVDRVGGCECHLSDCFHAPVYDCV